MASIPRSASIECRGDCIVPKMTGILARIHNVLEFLVSSLWTLHIGDFRIDELVLYVGLCVLRNICI